MATNTELVQQLYVAYFNRPADVASLEYYVSILDASADPAATAKVISKDFANATEYKSVYANLSADATINTIYHNLFGHEADIPGLKYWSALYAAGTITLAEIVTAVAAGAQGSDATAYNNKVTAAAAFTDTIALSADQQVAYASNPDALALAQSYLAGVTDDASLAAAVADVATTAAGVVPSVVKTLTVGVDTLTGTTGNDVFNTVVLDATSHLAVNVLNAADTIDGGAGTNTVNITNGGAGINDTIVGTFKNIQIFNIDNTAGAAAAAAVTGTTVVDASKLGTAAKQIWQISKAADVTNLGASTTAGFKSIATAATTLNVGAAAAATSVTVALKDVVKGTTVAATGDKLTSVILSGNAVDGVDAGTAIGNILVTATAAKDAQTFTLKSGVNSTLTVAETGGSTKHLTTIDLSASTGDITYDAAAVTTVSSVKGGSGDDTITITTVTNKAATGVAAIGATVDTGAGDNTVNVKTTGTGATTVTGGDGVDTVNILTRGDGKLTVNLGAGDDIFTVDTTTAAILAGDVIDGGAGTDTLALQVVGSNNIGSFVNFEVFDVVGLNHNLDVSILATNNTVTEFVASGAATTGVTLENIGAGVGYRVTGDAGLTNAVTLTQKTAGALSVSVDSHETAAAAATGVNASVVASNATSVAVAFKESFVDDASGLGDNVATLKLSTAAATAVTVASGGGDNASNVLQLTDTGAKLTSLTITGDTDVSLALTSTTKLATVDSTAATGGVTLNAAQLNGGVSATIKLGSGTDLIDVTTVTKFTTAAVLDSITGFEKATAAAIGTDTTAANTAIAAADKLNITAATIGTNAVAGTLTNATDSIKDGVLTFGGAGVTSFADAVLRASNDLAGVAGATVVFTYQGDTYVFSGGATAGSVTDDLVVKLTGVTGVTNLALDADSHLYIV